MQLTAILLLAAVVLSDQGLGQGVFDRPVPMWAVTAAACVSPLVLVLAARVLTLRLIRTAERMRSIRPMLTADRFIRLARWAILGNHAAVTMLMGWLGVVRTALSDVLGTTTGDVILLDELLAMLPAILGLIMLWWAYEPLHRRMAESLMLRHLDTGEGTWWHPSPFRYVLQETRAHLLLMLVPLLLILALGEAADPLVDSLAERLHLGAWAYALNAVPAVAVFFFFPVIMRLILDTRSVPPGPLRDELSAICTRHGVRVRDIRIWNTDGAHVNAAVMGLAGRLRYVLLTDGLIERMTTEQLLAVMAHEIGHVRRHHMPWSLMALLACGVIASFMLFVVLVAVDAFIGAVDASVQEWMEIAISVLHMALTLTLVGWVFRRFERQADTFAVQHLSGYSSLLGAVPAPQRDITPQAVHAMTSALESVSRLNMVEADRPSWRHGSIRFRQRYLLALTGTSVERPMIDRVVRRIKVASVLVALIGLPLWGWMNSQSEPEAGSLWIRHEPATNDDSFLTSQSRTQRP